ncbi:MAG: hypothetical protein PVF49_00875 [Anaerolineales bacterium]|jgi:hypothetical protein
MKSQFQQFLQQQQKQQQQQQQRMAQGAAWMEQQKRQQQMAAQSGANSQKDVDQRFSRVEQEAALLRQQFAAGKLSEEALVNKLSELMVQDAGGTWWMVGTESGRWYRYDGKNWVPGLPPGRGAARFSPAAGVPTKEGSKIKAFFTFIIGIMFTTIMFFMVGGGSYDIIRDIDYDLAEPVSYLIAAVVGLIGLIMTWRSTRKAARGY